jgi:hypothetical protein
MSKFVLDELTHEYFTQSPSDENVFDLTGAVLKKQTFASATDLADVAIADGDTCRVAFRSDDGTMIVAGCTYSLTNNTLTVLTNKILRSSANDGGVPTFNNGGDCYMVRAAPDGFVLDLDGNVVNNAALEAAVVDELAGQSLTPSVDTSALLVAIDPVTAALEAGDLRILNGDQAAGDNAPRRVKWSTTVATDATTDFAAGVWKPTGFNQAGGWVLDYIITGGEVLDEDDMSSESTVRPPSQRSVKRFVRALGISAFASISAAIAQGVELPQSFIVADYETGIYTADAADFSSVLIMNSQAMDSIDATANTLTKSGHGYVTGDGCYVPADAAGLTAETIYWIRDEDGDVLSLHPTILDAFKNTNAIDLTGSTAPTLRLLLDPLGAVYAIADGDKLDGSEGVSKRIYSEGVISAEWFGARGNAATGQTADAVTLETAAMRRMYRFARYWATALDPLVGTNDGLNRGCVCYVPSGHYRVDDEITAGLPAVNGVKFKGDGMRSTVLTMVPAGKDLIAFNGEKDRTTPIFGCGVEDLTVECEAADVYDGGTLIKYYHINGAFGNRIEFKGGHRGIWATRIANPGFFDQLYFHHGNRATGGEALFEFDSDSDANIGGDPDKDRTNTTSYIGRMEAAMGVGIKLSATNATNNVLTLTQTGKTTHELETGYRLRWFDDYDTFSVKDEVFFRKLTDTTGTLHSSRDGAVNNTNQLTFADGVPGRLCRSICKYGFMGRSLDGVFISDIHTQGCDEGTVLDPTNSLANDKVFSLRIQKLYGDNGNFAGLALRGEADDGYRIVDVRGGEIQDNWDGVVLENEGLLSRFRLNLDEIRNCYRWGVRGANANSENCHFNVQSYVDNNRDNVEDGGDILLDGDGHIVGGNPQFLNTTTNGHALRIASTATNVDIDAPALYDSTRTKPVRVDCDPEELKRFNVRYLNKAIRIQATAGVATIPPETRKVEILSTEAGTVSITGVDAAADSMTATGHNMFTGCRFTVGVTIAGIEASTNYVLQRIDGDTVAVHNSIEDALADRNRVALTDPGNSFDLTIPDTAEVDTIAGVKDGDSVQIRFLGPDTGKLINGTGTLDLNNSRNFTQDTVRDAISIERRDARFTEQWRNSFGVPLGQQTRTIGADGTVDLSAFSEDLVEIEVVLLANSGTEDTLTGVTGLGVGQRVVWRAGSNGSGQHKITVDGDGTIFDLITDSCVLDQPEQALTMRKWSSIQFVETDRGKRPFLGPHTVSIGASGVVDLSALAGDVAMLEVDLLAETGTVDTVTGVTGLGDGQSVLFRAGNDGTDDHTITIAGGAGMKLEGLPRILDRPTKSIQFSRRASGEVVETGRSAGPERFSIAQSGLVSLALPAGVTHGVLIVSGGFGDGFAMAQLRYDQSVTSANYVRIAAELDDGSPNTLFEGSEDDDEPTAASANRIKIQVEQGANAGDPGILHFYSNITGTKDVAVTFLG